MHYYQFNIGDYRRDTNHLTLLEHGIYRSLLDSYYLSEKPLTEDIDDLMRTHCIRSAEEKQSLENVLKDFFVLTKKGYVHKKCEDQISKYNEKSEKARASANKRWNAKAMRTHSEGNANHKPITNNHKPIKQDTSKPKVPPCPHLEIVGLYNEILPELQTVIPDRWEGSARAKNLQARWREDTRHQDLDFWKAYFTKVRSSDWHMGKVNGWSADLGWLVNRSNFDKMVERFFA